MGGQKTAGYVIHENSRGVQMIRYDYTKRSKVRVCSGGYSHRIYRFNKVDSPYTFPLCSWANLDCCGGWIYDEEYLKTAVQQGKKPYAGIVYRAQDRYLPILPPKEEIIAAVEEIVQALPEGITGGFESMEDDVWVRMFVCREGKLSDYYSIEDVCGHYELLGIDLSSRDKDEFRRLWDYELKQYASRLTPFSYLDPQSAPELITTGLLLGYPLESTASLLTE